MKKLIIVLLFAAFLPHAALAVSGPTQWSLAGVASWAQPLTASGTALPATASYAIGDLFALYGGAASTTFELYRLCASGTAGVWRNTGSGGVTGDYATTASFTAHTGENENPHGEDLVQYNLNVTNTLTANKYYFPNSAYSGAIVRTMLGSDTVLDRSGYVVAASYSAELADTVVVLAPASSTHAIGVVYSSAAGGEVLVQIVGECLALVASDSEAIAPGDWVLTSDTTPGHVMRAASAGDVPLSSDELQRRLGYATFAEFQAGGATCTWIILKGNR